MTNGKTIDCNDPKNKNTIGCQLGDTFMDILGYSIIVGIITFVAWTVGIILIVIFSIKHPQHRGIIIAGGISLMLLVPIIPILLQKYANWPLH